MWCVCVCVCVMHCMWRVWCRLCVWWSVCMCDPVWDAGCVWMYGAEHLYVVQNIYVCVCVMQYMCVCDAVWVMLCVCVCNRELVCLLAEGIPREPWLPSPAVCLYSGPRVRALQDFPGPPSAHVSSTFLSAYPVSQLRLATQVLWALSRKLFSDVLITVLMQK